MNTQEKKWRIGVTVLVIVSMGLGATLCGFAQETKKPRNEIFESIVKELNLTPFQKEEIARQRSAQREESQKIKNELQERRNELSRELAQPSSEGAKIEAIIASMKELIGRRLEQRVESILAMKQVLTPEQFKALNEKTKSIHGKRRAR